MSDDERNEDARRVFLWRCQYLVGLGYEEVEAARVADNPAIDVHQIERMVQHGCPLDLALEIAA
jgi:hypothetical protein